MMDPILALIVALLLGLTAALLLWPTRGLLWRAVRALRVSDRVMIEDALKHIHDCEYHDKPCTLHSLGGALGLSGNRAAELSRRLEELELIRTAEGGIKLTAEGRGIALRVIRIHRLWERYLSDETGLSASEWHSEAERREHTTTPGQAALLAARTGDPRFDPHGDPIPTEDGEIIPPRGRPLPDLPIGALAEIVHVEDEPESIYAQIVAEGLHPGMRVRVAAVSSERIRFEADAEEHVLAPIFAANLWAVPLQQEQGRMEGPFERLSGLEPGEQARVIGISNRCRGMERRRMLDLGIVPGTVVQYELTSAGGDPVAYRIRGAVIALRSEQADLIHIDRSANGATG
jgi:DtxR family Mn-dependent transcriptional regulator